MLSVSTQIARGEELAAFAEMLASVAFADELVVFNMERRDKEMLALCKQYHARVIDTKTPRVVEAIRLKQLTEAKGDWVLVMDYDEVITPKLAKEIMAVMREGKQAAYYVKRENYSLKRRLAHGGFGDDLVPRLFRQSAVIDWPTNIHALPIVTGSIGRLTAPMQHYKDHSVEEMVEKTNRYSEVEAAQFLAGTVSPVTGFTLIRKWWMETFRRAVLKGGLLDGPIGLIQSLYQGFSVFISYAKLYEKQGHKS